ncbi:peptidase associated/transthyretin-like domain-containing protein [Hanstruepera marina]|uniref:hypothetical protein n=1 Tax=Hanstruepera marina TaxID=2873265 RepID=UPI001CA6484A|nr:hypothetical protein [Hanstruepera marina]
MKKLAFFALGLLCLNCTTIQYDVSTRLVFEGQVNDRQGNPISNNDIEAWIKNSNDIDLIGFTTSNSNGHFELVIPSPKNETDFEITVKGNSIYRGKEYVNIYRSDFQDYYFNLDEIILIEFDDISELIITLNQSNQENTITNIDVSGIIADQTIWVNPVQEEYPEYYHDSYYRQVAKNQTLNLHYEVRNTTGQTNQFNEIINVGSDDTTTYVINY